MPGPKSLVLTGGRRRVWAAARVGGHEVGLGPEEAAGEAGGTAQSAGQWRLGGAESVEAGGWAQGAGSVEVGGLRQALAQWGWEIGARCWGSGG